MPTKYIVQVNGYTSCPLREQIAEQTATLSPTCCSPETPSLAALLPAIAENRSNNGNRAVFMFALGTSAQILSDWITPSVLAYQARTSLLSSPFGQGRGPPGNCPVQWRLPFLRRAVRFKQARETTRERVGALVVFEGPPQWPWEGIVRASAAFRTTETTGADQKTD